MTYNEFLEFTPYEFRLKVEAYIEKINHQKDELITSSWLTAKLVRDAVASLLCKEADFPKLQDLLEMKETKKEQSPEEMESIITMFNAAFGGKTTIEG